MMKRHNPKKDAVFFAVIMILVLVMLYSGLQILESTVLYYGSNKEENIESKTIVVDGVAYFPRQDITVVLVLGIVFSTSAVKNAFMSYTVYYAVIAGLMLISLAIFLFTVREPAWAKQM
jgi:hypothetical protein